MATPSAEDGQGDSDMASNPSTPPSCAMSVNGESGELVGEAAADAAGGASVGAGGVKEKTEEDVEQRTQRSPSQTLGGRSPAEGGAAAVSGGVGEGREGGADTRKTKKKSLLLPGDGFSWLKYGEKQLVHSQRIRAYFRCSKWKELCCDAKKFADFTAESRGFGEAQVTYVNQHSHPPECLGGGGGQLLSQLHQQQQQQQQQSLLSPQQQELLLSSSLGRSLPAGLGRHAQMGMEIEQLLQRNIMAQQQEQHEQQNMLLSLAASRLASQAENAALLGVNLEQKHLLAALQAQEQRQRQQQQQQQQQRQERPLWEVCSFLDRNETAACMLLGTKQPGESALEQALAQGAPSLTGMLELGGLGLSSTDTQQDNSSTAMPHEALLPSGRDVAEASGLQELVSLLLGKEGAKETSSSSDAPLQEVREGGGGAQDWLLQHLLAAAAAQNNVKLVKLLLEHAGGPGDQAALLDQLQRRKEKQQQLLLLQEQQQQRKQTLLHGQRFPLEQEQQRQHLQQQQPQQLTQQEQEAQALMLLQQQLRSQPSSLVQELTQQQQAEFSPRQSVLEQLLHAAAELGCGSQQQPQQVQHQQKPLEQHSQAQELHLQVRKCRPLGSCEEGGVVQELQSTVESIPGLKDSQLPSEALRNLAAKIGSKGESAQGGSQSACRPAWSGDRLSVESTRVEHGNRPKRHSCGSIPLLSPSDGTSNHMDAVEKQQQQQVQKSQQPQGVDRKRLSDSELDTISQVLLGSGKTELVEQGKMGDKGLSQYHALGAAEVGTGRIGQGPGRVTPAPGISKPLLPRLHVRDVAGATVHGESAALAALSGVSLSARVGPSRRQRRWRDGRGVAWSSSGQEGFAGFASGVLTDACGDAQVRSPRQDQGTLGDSLLGQTLHAGVPKGTLCAVNAVDGTIANSLSTQGHCSTVALGAPRMQASYSQRWERRQHQRSPHSTSPSASTAPSCAPQTCNSSEVLGAEMTFSMSTDMAVDPQPPGHVPMEAEPYKTQKVCHPPRPSQASNLAAAGSYEQNKPSVGPGLSQLPGQVPLLDNEFGTATGIGDLGRAAIDLMAAQLQQQQMDTALGPEELQGLVLSAQQGGIGLADLVGDQGFQAKGPGTAAHVSYSSSFGMSDLSQPLEGCDFSDMSGGLMDLINSSTGAVPSVLVPPTEGSDAMDVSPGILRTATLPAPGALEEKAKVAEQIVMPRKSPHVPPAVNPSSHKRQAMLRQRTALMAASRQRPFAAPVPGRRRGGPSSAPFALETSPGDVMPEHLDAPSRPYPGLEGPAPPWTPSVPLGLRLPAALQSVLPSEPVLPLLEEPWETERLSELCATGSVFQNNPMSLLGGRDTLRTADVLDDWGA